MEMHWYVLERYVSHLTGRQHCVKTEPDSGDADDKTDVKSVCSKTSENSSGSELSRSRSRADDDDWCSSPRYVVVLRIWKNVFFV